MGQSAILQILLFLPLLVNCQQRAKYGEPCGVGIRCESRSSLRCIENTCQCLKPDEMVYHEVREKCLVLLGERCSYTAVEVLNEGLQWTEIFECRDNANCSTTGFCECSNDYFDDLKGNCVLAQVHGGNCTSGRECRREGGERLSCINGKCSCANSKRNVFVMERGSCSGKAGTSCLFTSDCVPNAQCASSSNLCTCESNHKQSKRGLCLKKYGASCVLSSECWEEFTCLSGSCQCRFPSYQSYDSSMGRCISSVGGPCYEMSDEETELQSYPCVQNSECSNVTGVYECTCSEGLAELNKACTTSTIKHGISCTDSNQCKSVSVLDLVCRNGMCNCNDLKVYDKTEKRCLGLIGASCNITLNECVEGAYCIPGAHTTEDPWNWTEYYHEYYITKETFKNVRLSEIQKMSGVCRCRRPYQPTSKRTCTLVTM